MKYKNNELKEILDIKELTSDALETLLNARKEGSVDFKLIDIREVYEFTDMSIVGTDLLYPTTMIQKFLPEFEKMRDIPVILYCRTGSRTGYIMSALENMGYTNISHLSNGILSFHGEKARGANIPNQL